jgi:hypothetical protein
LERANDEPALLNKLRGVGDISQNLALFAKENFTGKVSNPVPSNVLYFFKMALLQSNVANVHAVD